jgi:hypothetical protein
LLDGFLRFALLLFLHGDKLIVHHRGWQQSSVDHLKNIIVVEVLGNGAKDYGRFLFRLKAFVSDVQGVPSNSTFCAHARSSSEAS